MRETTPGGPAPLARALARTGLGAGALAALALLAALAVLAALAPVTPATAAAGAVVVHAGALLVLLHGVRRHRPQVRRAWAAPAALLVTTAAAEVAVAATGGDPGTLRLGLAAVQLVALTAVPFTVRTLRAADPGTGQRTWPDVLLTTAGTALLAVQLLAVVRAVGVDDPAVLTGVVADVVLAVVVLRLLTTRTGTAPATVLVVLALALSLVTSTLLTALSDVVADHGPLLRLPGALAALLLAAAAQHPSMRRFATPAGGGQLRGGAQRLLTVVPVFCAVPTLWLLGRLGVLPDVAVAVVAPAGYVLACTGVLLAALSLRRSERAADHDPLTDLVNRRGLPRAVAGLRARVPGAALDVCLVDLDDFKQLNDTRGHAVGDALLLDVAGRLRRAVGPHGVVCRTGGDEFIAVVSTEPLGEGPGDLLLEALEAPFDATGVPWRVTASVGTAPLPEGVELEQALVDADVAMYAAKQAGKGRALAYRPQLREKVLGALALQQELRRLLLEGAPAEEVGELVVVHQPVVTLDPVRVVATEALVRWRHPRAGLLRPDEFLPQAEAAGLGARLDEHVTERALGHLAGWDAQGLPPLHLHVNLGVGSLLRRGTVRWVSALAARHGIDPDRLHLEITEHEELPDDPWIAESLREVVAAGFHLDLDDFGIGYTSLSYLRRFPVSTVKLDRSLTSLVSAGGDVPLLTGITALCRALDLQVLAEGVEHEGQLAPLRALGVRLAQGNHLGAPMPAEDVPGWVRRTGGAGCPPDRAAEGDLLLG
ncbi:putative bifunctional diguanylate cyclase/phosphodiesterase [Kineococcus terrestris]|uniref:putative bifunctional diguanylate cyclase/phosphodiesterase n=1 Tax=Kineococcus terrestris TaxID=2044856 RepID=UPI0034DAE5EA